MTRRTKDIVLDSVSSTALCAGPGEMFVVQCRGPRTAEVAVVSLRKRLSDARGCVTVSFLRGASDTTTPRDRQVIDLATPGSRPIAVIQRSVRRARPRSAILFPFPDPLPGWLARPTAYLKFFHDVSALMRRTRLTGVWVLQAELQDPVAAAAITDEAEFFVDVFDAGGRDFVQFIKAKEMSGPGFFRPRSVRVTTSEIWLESAAGTSEPLPAPLADGIESAYRSVFESFPFATILLSVDGSRREPNRRAVDMLGYATAELGTLGLRDVVGRESYFCALRCLALVKAKKTAEANLTLRRKSGRQLSAHVAVARITGGGYAAILHDVTSVNRDEQLQHDTAEMFRRMVDGSAHPQAVAENRRIVAANRAFAASFPWRDAGAGSQPGLAQVFGKENADVVRDLTALSRPGSETGESLTRDVCIATPDGISRMYQLVAVPLAGPPVSRLHLTLVDVTDRNAVLRSLADSERRFRSLIDNSIGAVSVASNAAFTFVNKAFLELFGFLSAEHVIGQPVALIASGRERKVIDGKFGLDGLASGGVRQTEIAGVTTDGRRLTLAVTLQRIEFEGSESVLCYWRDSSGERDAAAEVRRRARELDITERVLEALHRSIEPRDVSEAGLDASLKWLGFDTGALFLRDGNDFSLSAGRELPGPVSEALARQSATEGLFGFVAKTNQPLITRLAEYPAHLPYRSLFEVQGYQTVAAVPLIAHDSALAILLLCSKRSLEPDELDPALFGSVARHFGHALSNARTFDQVRLLEHLYHTAVDSLDDVVYQALPTGAMVFVSPQVERLLGYPAEDFVRSPELWRSLCHPDDRTRYGERVSAAALGHETHLMEYRVLPKGKAEYRWVRELLRYRRDSNGTLESLHGIVTDCTELVGMRDRIAKSGTSADALIAAAQEGIAVFDTHLVCTSWNPALAAMTGVGAENAIGRSGAGDFPGLPRAVASGMLQQALNGEAAVHEASVHQPGPNPERLLAIRCVPRTDADGSRTGAIIFVTDRTELRTFEHQARESEETLRNLIDAMGDALLISDLQGRVWDVNKEFLALTGFPRTEVIGATFPYPWLVEDEMAKMVLWIAAMREKKFLRDFDMTWRQRDGRTVAISLNTTLLRNATGEPVAMLNIARNISERIRLANELATKNRQMEMLNRVISRANSAMEFGELFETIATEVQTILPYEQISVSLLSDDRQSMRRVASRGSNQASLPVGSIVPLSRTISRVAVETGKPGVYSDLGTSAEFGPDVVSIAEGLKSEISIPVILNERVLGTLNVGSLEAASFNGTELSYLHPIADQLGALIERTQLFQRVREDSTYIHNLLDSIESVVYTVDPFFRVRDVNKAWGSFADLQGLDHLRTEESVVGRKLEEIVVEPGLWTELKTVMPQLFARHLELFTRSFEVERDGGRRMFQLVVTPMEIAGRVTGLVFTYTDVTEIKRREAEIRSRNRQLLALNAISTSISQSLNVDAVLDIGADGTLEIVGGKAVIFYLWDEIRRAPSILRHPGIPDSVAASFGDSAELAHTVITGQSPVFIRRSMTEDGRLSGKERDFFQRLGVKSLACLPLTSKDRVRGAILVAFAGEHEFGEQEEKFLELIGNTIASAIENAQLYAEVHGQVRVVTSLYELGKRLTGALDKKTVLEVLSNEVRKSIPFAIFEFDALSPDGRGLERVYHAGDPDLFFGDQPDPLTADVYEKVFVAHAAHLGVDARGRPFLAVPVRSENRITGVLSITGSAKGVYDNTHLRLLESIGNLAGIALDRAALYDDTVSKSIEIEQRNRDLDDFTYVVSHDLKEPLITIEGYSKIVLKDYAAQLDQQGQEFLSAVVQSTARMKNLIDDLLTLSRVGRAAESIEEVSVGAVLEDILRDFQFTLRARNATVDLPPVLPHVRYNQTQLGMVFRNLIGNGLKFNDNANPKVEIGVTESGSEFTFTVKDNGIGIEEQHFEKIFVIFQRLNRTEQYHGTGAGLTIVRKIVENHGGRIWLESKLERGTTFFFTIPK